MNDDIKNNESQSPDSADGLFISLTPEQADLENLLAQDTASGGEFLRSRVLDAVACELASTAGAAGTTGMSKITCAGQGDQNFWQFAAAVAAVFLLLANLSIVAMMRTHSGTHTPLDPAVVAAMVEKLTELDLGLSDREIRRQCLIIAAAGDKLLPLATPRGCRTDFAKLENFDKLNNW